MIRSDRIVEIVPRETLKPKYCRGHADMNQLQFVLEVGREGEHHGRSRHASLGSVPPESHVGDYEQQKTQPKLEDHDCRNEDARRLPQESFARTAVA